MRAQKACITVSYMLTRYMKATVIKNLVQIQTCMQNDHFPNW